MRCQKRFASRTALSAALALALAWGGVPASARAEVEPVPDDGPAPEVVSDAEVTAVPEVESVSDSATEVESVPDFAPQAEPEPEADSEPEYITDSCDLELYQGGSLPGLSENPGETKRTTLVGQEVAKEFNALVNAGLKSVSKSIDVASLGLTPDEATVAYQDFINDHPNYFYVDALVSFGYQMWGDERIVTRIIPSYLYDTEEIPAMRTEYEATMMEVLSWVPAGASDATKAKAVHDWLVRNCAYSTTAVDLGYEGYVANYGVGPWNAYGALVDKVAVCQGYALAYADALTRIGVRCQLVANEDVAHAWNRVRVNGHWYHVDVTWDDPLLDGVYDGGFDAEVNADYFLKSDAWMRADAEKDDERTHAEWSPAGTESDDTSFDKKKDWATFSGPAEHPLTASIGDATVKLSQASFVYSGTVCKPAATVTLAGKTLRAGKDYTLSYSKNRPKAAGTYKVTVTGKGAYAGTKTVKYTVKKVENTLSVKAVKRTVAVAKVKAGDIVVACPMKVTEAAGELTYKKVSGSKRLSVNEKNGKVTVLKGTKKGTYKIKVNVADAGSKNYESGAQTVICKVVVS